VLLKTLLIEASADERSETYTVYVTLTSVSRAWRETIIGQPWFHATPTQPNLLPSDDDGKYRVFREQKIVYLPQKMRSTTRTNNAIGGTTGKGKDGWDDTKREKGRGMR